MPQNASLRWGTAGSHGIRTAPTAGTRRCCRWRSPDPCRRTSSRIRMTMADIEQVPTSILCEERCHLGEGPTYDRATDTAWWFDILAGRLFEARVADGQVRVHQLGRMASALARIDAGRQLVV